jgi:hypothetical protein
MNNPCQKSIIKWAAKQAYKTLTAKNSSWQQLQSLTKFYDASHRMSVTKVKRKSALILTCGLLLLAHQHKHSLFNEII